MTEALAEAGPLWLLGAGNMGGAMLRGWIAAGVDPAAMTVIDPGEPAVPLGVRRLIAPPPDGEVPATLILAVKPQLLDATVPALSGAVTAETLVVSILAGVEIASLRQRLPTPRAVVRAMPNTPAAIGRGVTALFADGADAGQRERAAALMAALGSVEWIAREALFDAVTALSGCGPAFLFRLVDALAGAGTRLGLEAAQAARLARDTVAGAAELVVRSEDSAAILADRVASPGGATRAGLDVLDADRALAGLLERTLEAAAARSAAMAAAARG